MELAIGYAVGVATCAFIATALAYFRRPIIQTLSHVEDKLANAGPRPRGYLFDPEPPAEAERRRILRENAEKGKDTPISELQ